MTSVAEVLDKAADLIEPEGKWIKGALAGSREGWPLRGALTGADFSAYCWCAFGAIQKAGWLWSRDEEKRRGDGVLISFHRSEIKAAELVVKAAGLGDARDIVGWNDAPERTQAEVVAKLREAATLAREQGK